MFRLEFNRMTIVLSTKKLLLIFVLINCCFLQQLKCQQSTLDDYKLLLLSTKTNAGSNDVVEDELFSAKLANRTWKTMSQQQPIVIPQPYYRQYGNQTDFRSASFENESDNFYPNKQNNYHPDINQLIGQLIFGLMFVSLKQLTSLLRRT